MPSAGPGCACGTAGDAGVREQFRGPPDWATSSRQEFMIDTSLPTPRESRFTPTGPMTGPGPIHDHARRLAPLPPSRGQPRAVQVTGALIALMILGTLLRWHRLGYQSFWNDEIVTWLSAQGSAWNVITQRIENSNIPPLYYLIARCGSHPSGTAGPRRGHAAAVGRRRRALDPAPLHRRAPLDRLPHRAAGRRPPDGIALPRLVQPGSPPLRRAAAGGARRAGVRATSARTSRSRMVESGIRAGRRRHVLPAYRWRRVHWLHRRLHRHRRCRPGRLRQ